MKYTTVSKKAAALILALSVSSCGTSLDVDVSELSSGTSTVYAASTQPPATVPDTVSEKSAGTGAVTTTSSSADTSGTPAVTMKRIKVINELNAGFTEGCLPVDLPITWIGDSYSTENIERLRKRFSDLDFGTENAGNLYSPYSYIQCGKHTDWLSFPDNTESAVGGPSCVDILDSISQLRPYLVIALGTNDAAVTSEQMTATLDHIAQKVGDSTTVILMTAYIPGGNYDAANEVKRKYAEEHDNFYTADWAAVALEDYYIQSSIHPYDNGGYNAWADLFYFTLLQIEKERQTR